MRVLRVPPERLDAFEQALLDRAGRHLERPGEHERFRIEMGRWQLVGYDSGKVTVLDEDLMPVVEEVLEEVLAGADGPVVGSDEAGKGEWLGPLTAAACAVQPGQRAPLAAEGVMDSKELSREQVREAADRVEARLDHRAVVLVSPPRFNELFAEFRREGQSLDDLVAWAHARAIADVLGDLEAAGRAGEARVVVDEFDRVATQARTRQAFDVDRHPVEQRTQAEDELAVAAASVLAKAARERWIDRYEERSPVAIRQLDRAEAREREDVAEFAKTRYVEP